MMVLKDIFIGMDSYILKMEVKTVGVKKLCAVVSSLPPERTLLKRLNVLTMQSVFFDILHVLMVRGVDDVMEMDSLHTPTHITRDKLSTRVICMSVEKDALKFVVKYRTELQVSWTKVKNQIGLQMRYTIVKNVSVIGERLV